MFSYVSNSQSLPTHQGLADRPGRIFLVEHDLHNTEPGLHVRLLVLLLAEEARN